MNEKMQKLQKELAQMYQKKTATISDLEKQLADAEANIEKCAAEMTTAAKNENFEDYKAAAMAKGYHEGRITFINDKLEKAKKGPDSGYTEKRQAIKTTFETEYNEFLKAAAEIAIKLDEMQQKQRQSFSDAQALLDMLNNIYDVADTGKNLNVLDYSNAWQWASRMKNNGTFNSVVAKYPELLKK